MEAEEEDGEDFCGEDFFNESFSCFFFEFSRVRKKMGGEG